MPTSVHEPAVFLDTLSRIALAAQATHAVRACLVTTRDREQAINLVREAAKAASAPLYHFTVAVRRRYVPERLSWDRVGEGVHDPSNLFDCVTDTHGAGIFILEDCLSFLRDDGGDRSARTKFADLLAPESDHGGFVLVFVEPPDATRYVPAMLADQIAVLDVPYPRTPELGAIAREEVAAMAQRAGVQIALDEIRRVTPDLADGLVSFTLTGARNTLRDALCRHPEDLSVARDFLQQRKSERLSRELSMEVLDTNDVEEPVGLDYLVKYLQVRKDRMRVTGRDRARGVLLVGPPGTGKTMLARAIGQLVGLPVVEFRISSLLNSLVGESEQSFARAFATFEAMAPNVVFIDELEKAFGDSSERDGGTMMRCTGALLSWLSDNPYPNFIVATCNNLTRMGEIGKTMTRPGRFNAAFFVDVPSRTSRVTMLSRWLTGKIDNVRQVAEPLADQTERFSGADLYAVVQDAIAEAEYEHRKLTVSDLSAQMESKRLRAQAMYDEFAGLRRWAAINCRPAGPRD